MSRIHGHHRPLQEQSRLQSPFLRELRSGLRLPPQVYLRIYLDMEHVFGLEAFFKTTL